MTSLASTSRSCRLFPPALPHPDSPPLTSTPPRATPSLDIFLAHRHQCAFDVHVGRFKASLLLPGAAKPHPSLVDAIYLLGCFFSRAPAYTELEPHFLRRSLRGIADALQHSDRIVHVLQASCLLAVYFFWHGRTLEGYYHSSIAARLAVGLGLHQIRPREWQQGPYARGAGGNAYAGPSSYSHQHHHSQHQHHDAPAPLKASVPLSPPADDVEHAERVAAFWQIFAVDRAWAVATGLPTALPDDDHPRSRIETGWPTAIPDDPEVCLESLLLESEGGRALTLALAAPASPCHVTANSGERTTATVCGQPLIRFGRACAPAREGDRPVRAYRALLRMYVPPLSPSPLHLL